VARWGAPQPTATANAVSTTYPITGGLLARRAVGSITLSMHGGADGFELPRPLIDGLRNPTIAHDNRLHSLVPLELTSFDTAALAAITAARLRDRSERVS
jgi:hypothetical protein